MSKQSLLIQPHFYRSIGHFGWHFHVCSKLLAMHYRKLWRAKIMSYLERMGKRNGSLATLESFLFPILSIQIFLCVTQWSSSHLLPWCPRSFHIFGSQPREGVFMGLILLVSLFKFFWCSLSTCIGALRESINDSSSGAPELATWVAVWLYTSLLMSHLCETRFMGCNWRMNLRKGVQQLPATNSTLLKIRARPKKVHH